MGWNGFWGGKEREENFSTCLKEEKKMKGIANECPYGTLLRIPNYENVYRKLNCSIFNALNTSISIKSYYWRLLKSVFGTFVSISQKLKVREENSLL